MSSLSANRVRLSGVDVVLKTILDYVVTVPGLIILFPLWLALALAVAGFAGGQVGPKLSVRMPRERLRQVFTVVLLVVSGWMLVGVFA